MEAQMRATLLKLPEPPPEAHQTSQRPRQAQPKDTERYSEIWRRRNGLASAGAIEIPPGKIVGKVPVRSPAPVTDVWRQHAASRLHDLGSRPVLEALIEVAAGKPLDTVLANFSRLDPDIVHALRGDDFAPAVFAVSRA